MLVASLLIIGSCNKPQPIRKRVSIAKGNVSFILSDTTLVQGKPIIYPPDSAPDGSYGESAAFYHSPDSTTMISVYVTAIPGNKYYPALPWRVHANEKQARYVVNAKNQNLAVIERYIADSTTHAIELDYHLPKRVEYGRRGQASYAISLTFHGHYRRVDCHFLAPDNSKSRQMLAVIRNSFIVNPAYLSSVAKRYSEREYLD